MSGRLLGSIAIASGAWFAWQRAVSMTTLPPFARLIAALAEIRPGLSVYDPSAGTGMLLAAAGSAVKRDSGAQPVRLYGQELDALSIVIARTHLRARGLDAQLEHGDTLLSPRFVDDRRVRRFDRVLMNPVWEQAVPPTIFRHDPYRRFHFGPPPPEYADFGWIQHGLASLTTPGRMVAVLGAGALSRSAYASTQTERELRKAFVEADVVEAVIACSPNVEITGVSAIDAFLGRQLSYSAILVLDTGKRHPGTTLMVDAAALLAQHRRRPGTSSRILIDLVATGTEHDRVSRRVTADDLAGREFDLRPSWYVD
jgi:type I restriction enzyme M protein